MQLRSSPVAVISCAASFAFFSSCGGGHPPTPGQTCTPSPDSTGACYDAKHLVSCERQSDGAYRWSEFLECGADSRCSCGNGSHKDYPNVPGPCNCWAVSVAPPPDKDDPKPSADAAPPSDDEPPPPKTCANGAAVCLDFEDVPLHQAFGGIVTPQTSMTVEDTYAASGKQALRISIQHEAPTNIAEGEINFVAPSGGDLPPFPLDDVHGRLNIFVLRRPAVSWELIRAQDESTQGSAIGVEQDGSLVLWPNGGDTVVSSTKLPEGKWTCLQWETKRQSDGSATISLEVDGQPVDLHGGAARHDMAFGALFVGFEFLAFNDPSRVVGELWLDDIAFGTQPIPCTP